jgi:hypothetical protein
VLKVRELMIFLISIGISYSAYGLTEKELQALEKFSTLPPMIYSPEKIFIDFNIVPVSQKKYSPPLSLQETRSRLKERLALNINPSWRVGFDSFKVSPVDRSIIDWPTATQPKNSKTRSHKGYGVGVKMKLG